MMTTTELTKQEGIVEETKLEKQRQAELTTLDDPFGLVPYGGSNPIDGPLQILRRRGASLPSSDEVSWGLITNQVQRVIDVPTQDRVGEWLYTGNGFDNQGQYSDATYFVSALDGYTYTEVPYLTEIQEDDSRHWKQPHPRLMETPLEPSTTWQPKNWSTNLMQGASTLPMFSSRFGDTYVSGLRGVTWSALASQASLGSSGTTTGSRAPYLARLILEATKPTPKYTYDLGPIWELAKKVDDDSSLGAKTLVPPGWTIPQYRSKLGAVSVRNVPENMEDPGDGFIIMTSRTFDAIMSGDDLAIVDRNIRRRISAGRMMVDRVENLTQGRLYASLTKYIPGFVSRQELQMAEMTYHDVEPVARGDVWRMDNFRYSTINTNVNGLIIVADSVTGNFGAHNHQYLTAVSQIAGQPLTLAVHGLGNALHASANQLELVCATFTPGGHFHRGSVIEELLRTQASAKDWQIAMEYVAFVSFNSWTGTWRSNDLLQSPLEYLAEPYDGPEFGEGCYGFRADGTVNSGLFESTTHNGNVGVYWDRDLTFRSWGVCLEETNPMLEFLYQSDCVSSSSLIDIPAAMVRWLEITDQNSGQENSRLGLSASLFTSLAQASLLTSYTRFDASNPWGLTEMEKAILDLKLHAAEVCSAHYNFRPYLWSDMHDYPATSDDLGDFEVTPITVIGASALDHYRSVPYVPFSAFSKRGIFVGVEMGNSSYWLEAPLGVFRRFKYDKAGMDDADGVYPSDMEIWWQSITNGLTYRTTDFRIEDQVVTRVQGPYATPVYILDPDQGQYVRTSISATTAIPRCLLQIIDWTDVFYGEIVAIDLDTNQRFGGLPRQMGEKKPVRLTNTVTSKFGNIDRGSRSVFRK